MLSLGVLWHTALCWAAVLRTALHCWVILDRMGKISAGPQVMPALLPEWGGHGPQHPSSLFMHPHCLPSAWSRWEKMSLDSHLGKRVSSIPTDRGDSGKHRAEPGGHAPTQDQHQQCVFSTHLGETPPKMSTPIAEQPPSSSP